nr:hypothetical protein OH826_12225 [Streptomyces sp. NBC_00899]
MTHHPGESHPDAIDRTRFEALVRSGRDELRARNWESGALLLREALGLWRGPVLPTWRRPGWAGTSWRRSRRAG